MENSVQYALKIYPQLTPNEIFGIGAIRCFQNAIEETFLFHGLPLSLDSLFRPLLSQKDGEDPLTYLAVSIVIFKYFVDATSMVNDALKHVHRTNTLKFGTVDVISLPEPKNIDRLRMDRVTFEFLSSTADDRLFERVNSKDVLQSAAAKIQKFGEDTIYTMERSFGDDASKIFTESCKCFMAAMAMLVMKCVDDRLRKVSSALAK
jgi:hypothetical protein